MSASQDQSCAEARHDAKDPTPPTESRSLLKKAARRSKRRRNLSLAAGAVVALLGIASLGPGSDQAPQSTDLNRVSDTAGNSGQARGHSKNTTAPTAAPAPTTAAPAPVPVAAPAPAPAPAAAPAPAPAAAPLAPAAAPLAPAAAPAGAEAAGVLGWGPVAAGDEFNYAGSPDAAKWGMYDGAGHGGKGVRSPNALAVGNGVLTVTGDSAGTTGGMRAKFGVQTYGRWEARMKTNERDPKYHPVMILWPTAGWNWPDGPCWEIDYAEGTGSLNKMSFFNHNACPGQTGSTRNVLNTEWHNYAVEWSPAGVIGYIDGVKSFEDRDPSHIPNVNMWQTIQLDWFPDGSPTKMSQMYVDWVRVYNL